MLCAIRRIESALVSVGNPFTRCDPPNRARFRIGWESVYPTRPIESGRGSKGNPFPPRDPSNAAQADEAINKKTELGITRKKGIHRTNLPRLVSGKTSRRRYGTIRFVSVRAHRESSRGGIRCQCETIGFSPAGEKIEIECRTRRYAGVGPGRHPGYNPGRHPGRRADGRPGEFFPNVPPFCGS
ncbi:MAG: hypothetical protein JW810_05880 [Sedimentisphaerales bacterium]|nr:hypothetical protein [Sedimentisphaerales bacterium]